MPGRPRASSNHWRGERGKGPAPLDSAAAEVFTGANVGKRRREEATMGDAREVMDRVTAAVFGRDFDAAAACYAGSAVAVTPGPGRN